MNSSFFIYLEQLELMIFFSGYPLIYLLFNVIAETAFAKRIFKKDISTLLPYAYGFVGILYLGLQLKNLYPNYSIEHIKSATEIPLLKLWGLISILFLLPVFSKKPFYSLLHSLVFFFFLVRDLWLHAYQTSDGTVLKNDMNIYSYSLLINLAAFILILIVYFLFKLFKREKS